MLSLQNFPWYCQTNIAMNSVVYVIIIVSNILITKYNLHLPIHKYVQSIISGWKAVLHLLILLEMSCVLKWCNLLNIKPFSYTMASFDVVTFLADNFCLSAVIFARCITQWFTPIENIVIMQFKPDQSLF